MELIKDDDMKKIIEMVKPKSLCETHNFNITDNYIRALLENYLFLTNYSNTLIKQLQMMSEETLLYSRYYWFVEFMKKYFFKYGYNLGIEQQAYKILEEIDQQMKDGIDWIVIERIENG